jgi:acyl-CoA dehydrogenase
MKLQGLCGASPGKRVRYGIHSTSDAAKTNWEAANACMQTQGGLGLACEYDVECKFRETRLYQVAPISTDMILWHVAEHVLQLPRSY